MYCLEPENSIHLLIDFNKKLRKKRKRQIIKEHWKFRCAYCNDAPKNLTLDHVIPRSQGGTNDLHNLVSCCSYCNINKSFKNMEIWFKNQIFFSNERYQKIIDWVNSN